MKRNQNCTVVENRPLAEGIYQMRLTAAGLAEGVKAGQFLNLYTGDADLLLPRPISICRAEADEITLVYKIAGRGTERFSHYGPGREVRALLPLGNGFDLEEARKGQKVIVVGGGVGVPPMVQLAAELKRRGAFVTAVLGFVREPFLLPEMTALCDEVFVATDEGAVGFHGNALEAILARALTAERYFACGPKAMLRALAAHCAAQGKPLQVSLEERMGCGYGACVGCTCEIRSKETGASSRKRVCKDGPVFPAEEVVWDV